MNLCCCRYQCWLGQKEMLIDGGQNSTQKNIKNGFIIMFLSAKLCAICLFQSTLFLSKSRKYDFSL